MIKFIFKLIFWSFGGLFWRDSTSCWPWPNGEIIARWICSSKTSTVAIARRWVCRAIWSHPVSAKPLPTRNLMTVRKVRLKCPGPAGQHACVAGRAFIVFCGPHIGPRARIIFKKNYFFLIKKFFFLRFVQLTWFDTISLILMTLNQLFFCTKWDDWIKLINLILFHVGLCNWLDLILFNWF